MKPGTRTAIGLAGIVAASFAVRLLAAFLRPTPDLFPDEYTYAELARSLAESGLPLVRGEASNFPALLQPLLTAPAWLAGDVGVSYRLVQAIGALAMSLAAVPAFLIARRVGVGPALALGVAALALLAPALVYASFVASEPIAYPLLLTTLLVGVSALAAPRRRTQLAFVALVGLCAFTRVQFAALPLVFAAAVVGLGLRERRLRPALREQALPLALLLAPLALVVAARSTVLGAYGDGAGALRLHPLEALRWIGVDALTLAYASGWLLVPGALVGLALALFRPLTRQESALAMLTLPLAGALLLEAGLIQSGLQRTDTVQERYVFYVIPLIGAFFALYAQRGWPHRLAHLALAGVLLVLSVRVSLATYVALDAGSGSPLLFAVSWLVGALGEPGSASLAIAAAAGTLSLLAVCCSRRPRLGTPLALALAVGATAAASAGAVAFDARTTSAARANFLPADAQWVDRFGLDDVALVQAAGGLKTDALQQLFWNRTVDEVLVLPGAGRFDGFAAHAVDVAGDGTLLVGGEAQVRPLLVDGYGSTVVLRGARRLAASPTRTLWAPAGRPRLALYALGRYWDGWLAGGGAFYLWPSDAAAGLAGHLTIGLAAPADADRPFVLRFEGPGRAVTRATLAPGRELRVRIPVCSRGPWYATFASSLRGLVGLRVVSVRSSLPVYRPDPDACG